MRIRFSILLVLLLASVIQLRTQPVPPPATPAQEVALTSPPAAAEPVSAPRSRGLAVVGLVLALAAITIGISLAGGDKEPAVTRPVIAVLSLPMRAHDSATAWL